MSVAYLEEAIVSVFRELEVFDLRRAGTGGAVVQILDKNYYGGLQSPMVHFYPASPPCD